MKNGLPGFYRVSRHRGAAVRFLELLIDTTSRWWLRAWKSFFLLWSAVLRFPFFFTFCFSLFWPGTMACTVGVEWTVLMRVDRSTSVGRRRFFFPFRPVRFSFVSSPNRSSSSPRPQWDAADGSGRSGTTYVEKQPNTHGDDIKTKVKKKRNAKKKQTKQKWMRERRVMIDERADKNLKKRKKKSQTTPTFCISP